MKMESVKIFLKNWGPAIFMAILIFTMSSFKSSDSDTQSGLIINFITTVFPDTANNSSLIKIVRKTAHFLEYAIFGFFTARGFKKSNKNPWLATPTCALYAATDEFHQTFVPGRSGELGDILVDTFGAITGILIYYLTHRKK